MKSRYWLPKSFESLDELLSKYAEQNKNIFFVQVGSNDGKSNDPLYNFVNKYKWAGICVEPIPSNFLKLKETYADFPGIILVNAAIGFDGNLKLYCINNDRANQLKIDIPSWFGQLASFDKDLVVSDIKGEHKYEIIDEIEVDSISFETLFTQIKVPKINILHIDTEGADWKILQNFPFQKFTPDIVLFEQIHLSKCEYKAALKFLRIKKYRFWKVGSDNFSYQLNLAKVF